MNKTIKKSYIINFAAAFLLWLLLYTGKEFGFISNYLVGIIINTCIMIVMATSLNIVAGFLGEMALGHAGLMAIGAYSAAVTSMWLMATVEMPNILYLIIASLAGGLVAAAAGALISLPSMRLRGDYLGIVTIGFAEIIRIFFINFAPTGGAKGLTGIKRLTDISSAYWIMIIVVALIFTIGKSRYGRAIMSIREDEIASEASGIPTTKYKVLAFALSSFFAGIGGSLYAHYQGYLDPNKFQFMYSIEMFVIVVLGGLGSVTGSIVSAIVLTVLPELLRQFSSYRLLVYSAALVLMMIFRPQGIFGRYEFSLTKFMEGRKKKKEEKGSAA
ncbi:MAG: branched-chain amino acid ABC transporter permease [Eubacteriaceae bacterium]|jgi:branched-chain amino acid transport system permease protein